MTMEKKRPSVGASADPDTHQPPMKALRTNAASPSPHAVSTNATHTSRPGSRQNSPATVSPPSPSPNAAPSNKANTMTDENAGASSSSVQQSGSASAQHGGGNGSNRGVRGNGSGSGSGSEQGGGQVGNQQRGRGDGGQTSGDELPPAAGDAPPDPENDPLVKYQRAQLAARINEQSREIFWLRDKVHELTKLVAVLDAAPRAALYHMCAVREDLTVTLAKLGLSKEVTDASQCPIAATLLDAEIVTNDSLAEMPAALKNLTAQIILAMEKTASPPAQRSDAERKAADDEMHRRIREVSDQCERYAERDKQSLVSSTTFRDEFDDLREEASLQRRKIVSLEEKLQEKMKCISKLEEVKQEEERIRDDVKVTVKQENCLKHSSDGLPHIGGGASSSNINGGSGGTNKSAEHTLREMLDKRMTELQEMQGEIKRLTKENEGMRAEISRRDNNVVPLKTILGTAMYQTMETTLHQLYMKEKNWQVEREGYLEEREAERKDAAERLEMANANAEKTIEDLRRQLEETRRIADAAKVEKDKVMMTYDSRKVEASNAQSVISAAEKRATVCDEMREKLSKSNRELAKDVESLRSHVRKLEDELKDTKLADYKAVIEQMQKEVEEERSKSTAFIQEVESLSNMFGEVEGENKRVVRLLAEKEAVLSKVMAERLRLRQVLTTVKEENKALTQGRELDAEKLKQVNTLAATIKKMVNEMATTQAKGQEETRALSSTLEKRRRIADEASVKAAAATAQKEEMKRERDGLLQRAEQAVVELKEDQFEARRLRERLAEMELRMREADETVARQKAALETAVAGRRGGSGGGGGDDDDADGNAVRDEIIRDLNKKLNCSVVTNRAKEVMLVRCGHLFSRQCTDNLITTRNRKCPICGKPFGNDDVRSVFF